MDEEGDFFDPQSVFYTCPSRPKQKEPNMIEHLLVSKRVYRNGPISYPSLHVLNQLHAKVGS